MKWISELFISELLFRNFFRSKDIYDFLEPFGTFEINQETSIRMTQLCMKSKQKFGGITRRFFLWRHNMFLIQDSF